MEEMRLDNPINISKEVIEQANYFFEHDYQERGMMKWAGFFLSDHTEDVADYTNQRRANDSLKKLDEQSVEEATQLLFFAHTQQGKVAVQLKSRRSDGKIKPTLSGTVNGFFENNVYIDEVSIQLEDIQHVSLINF